MVDGGKARGMRVRRSMLSHLPFAAVSETIDYGRVRIGAADFLLPQSHTLAITDLEGHEGRNVTTLSACRQYAADSAEPVPQQKAEEPQLPAGIYLNLKLETRITFDQSAVGDPVSARLDRAFRATGISVPKGTLVSGHIRRIEERYQPEKHYLVGLDFSIGVTRPVASSWQRSLADDHWRAANATELPNDAGTTFASRNR